MATSVLSKIPRAFQREPYAVLSQGAPVLVWQLPAFFDLSLDQIMLLVEAELIPPPTCKGGLYVYNRKKLAALRWALDTVPEWREAADFILGRDTA